MLLRQPQHADLSRQHGEHVADPSARAVDLVTRIQSVLRRHDATAARDLGGSGGGGEALAAVVGNVDRLGLDRIALRYVDSSDAPLPAAQRDRWGPDAWVADVQVTWRLRGRDARPSTVEAPFVLSGGPQPGFLGVRSTPDQRVPLWLTGRLYARGTPRTFVEATSPAEARRLSREAVVAVRTVNRTLPRWQGGLVLEAPATAGAFSSASGLPPAQASGIAAVTTTTDTGGDARSPVHVYLNPRVFGPLGPRGQQIVVSHEATHVAVGAATTSLPLWLSEGYADYVALRFSRLPATVLGSQIRELVRKHGLPTHLPGQDEFAGDNPDVGAWYEGAWLAVRVLGERYGAEAVHRFYVEAEAHGVPGAFRDVLHTTPRAFVALWRQELRDLAG